MTVLRSKKLITHGFQDRYNNRIIRLYDTKNIWYGAYQDRFEYKGIRLTHVSQRVNYKKNRSGTKKDFSITRARETLYRLVTANVGRHGNFKPIFFTLTTASQISAYKESNRLIKAFVRRLNQYTGFPIRYVIVPELHKSGAIHYHGVFFNLPFVDIKHFRHELWKQGYVDLQVPRKIKSVGAYISKYMTKSYSFNTPLNTKLYFTSRGLIRPTVDFDNVPITGTILRQKDLKRVIIKQIQNEIYIYGSDSRD